MAATLERRAEQSLSDTLSWAKGLAEVQQRHREARVRFIRDAKAAGWSWARMGRALDITDAAVRRFWRDNRMVATRLGRNDEVDETQMAARAVAELDGSGGSGTTTVAAKGPGGDRSR